MVKLEQLEEVRIADLCFSPSVLAAIAEDPIDHDDNSDDEALLFILFLIIWDFTV